MSRLTLPDERPDRRTGRKAPVARPRRRRPLLLSGLLSWSYDDRILGDLSIRFYPAGIQLYAMLFGVIAVILGRAAHAPAPVAQPGTRPAHPRHHRARVRRLGRSRRSRTSPAASINANEGGWVALVGAVLLDRRRLPLPRRRHRRAHAGRG